MTRAPLGALAAAVATGGWALVAAGRTGGDPWPVVAVLGAALIGYGGGHLVQRWTAHIAIIVCGLVALAALASGDAFSTSPLAGPIGYANANAALYVQAGALAGLAAARSRLLAARLMFGLAAMVGAILPLLIHSAAAGVGGALVAVATIWSLSHPVRRTRAACLAAAIAVTIVVAGSVFMAERHGNGVPGDAHLSGAAAALSERRIELWRDAARLAVDHPFSGVGPGRFDESSAVAGFDPDTRAAHSAYLEMAAEIGIPGAALMLLAVLMALAGLWVGGATAAPALISVAAWSALWLHAGVDYVGDFPAVVATAALVAGLGTPRAWLKGPIG